MINQISWKVEMRSETEAKEWVLHRRNNILWLTGGKENRMSMDVNKFYLVAGTEGVLISSLYFKHFKWLTDSEGENRTEWVSLRW